MNGRIRFAALLVTVGVVGTSRGLNGTDALRMHVTPAVARAPALLTVRVNVRAAAENRTLQVVAESPDFYRSSQVDIDGLNSPALNVFEFPNLPQGQYMVRSVLVGAHGQRAEALQLAIVAPPFGR